MARLANQNSDSEGSEADYEDAVTQPSSKRQRLKNLGSTIKDAPKRTLLRMDILSNKDDQMDADGADIEGITDNPAFNTGKVFRKEREGPTGKAARAVDSVKSATRAVTHPRQHGKEKAARRMQPSQHPFLTAEADRELLQAHDDISISQDSSQETGGADDTLAQRDRLAAVEKERNAMRNAWITSRHVKRARAVTTGQMQRPRLADYRTLDGDGNQHHVDWGRYIAHMLLWLSDDFGPPYSDDSDFIAFKRGTLIHHFERFLLATTPWQTWLLHVRRVYMWEDVWLTGRWLATFLFLMKTGYFMTYFYLFIVYIVVLNHFNPSSVREMRRSHERAMDRGSHIHNIFELMQRHGDGQWIDPLLDEIGPLIQQQLGDFADYLEILQNFYSWSNPRATCNTIVFWLSCAAVSGLTSGGFGTSVLWWVAGLYFFASRPIASRYPRYRHLVSISRWVFWEIPTHAELAFQEIRDQATQSRLETMEERERDKRTAEAFDSPADGHADGHPIPTFTFNDGEQIADGDIRRRRNSDSESSSSAGRSGAEEDSLIGSKELILAFRGRCQSRTGRLSVTTTHLRFVTDIPRAEGFIIKEHEVIVDRPYSELLEMRKAKTAASSKRDKFRQKLVPTPQQALVLTWTDGTETRVEEMRKMDECFNTIIGFSGLRWQVCQPLMEDGEGNLEGEHDEDGEMCKNFFGKKSAIDELGKL